MSGTVNISRRLFDSEAFRDEVLTEREAWVWLVMAASWKARAVRSGDYVAETKRGQLAHSIRYMAKAWKWTPAKAQRYLKRLEKLKMICVETDTGVSVVTICKYDEYQNPTKAADTDAIQPRYRTDTEKKKDERREEGKDTVRVDPSDFEDFWEAFPHRNGKKTQKAKAIAAFSAALKSGVTVQQIAQGVEAMRRDPDVQRGYGRGPVPWLNQQGWADEIPDAPPQFKTIAGGQNDRTNNNRQDSRDQALADEILAAARAR